MTRTIVIGDVHGCLYEFDELLKAVGHRPAQDRLILAGDLLDRGPDSAGVVSRAMELNAECVIGNHEESHLRFRAHEILRERNGKKNPMKERPPGTPHRLVYDSLSEPMWDWLAGLPSFIHIDDKWTVVHAGCLPNIPVEEQEKKYMYRVRYVRRDTLKMAPLSEVHRHSTHAFWTELWTGPRSIVYGHQVERRGPVWSASGHSHLMINDDACLRQDDYPRTLGIDTGCAFGGKLTAAIFDGGSISFASVPAQGKYAELYNDTEEA